MASPRAGRYLLVLIAAGCNGTMESFFAQDEVDMSFDLPYVADGDPRHTLDFYAPRGETGAPVVVFVHGGFWIHQDKDFFQPVVGLYRNVGIALARRGIATAVIDYRLVPSVTFAEQFADVAASIAWVEQHAGEHGGDPSRIVVAGHSAGGHIAALAAFDSARLGIDTTPIKGYAPMSPILDLGKMAASDDPDAHVAHDVFGDDLVTFSPSTYFSPDTAPVSIILGDQDKPFLRDQVPVVVAELQAMGAPVTLTQVPGDHDAIVVDIDGDPDPVTPPLALFVATVTK
jgi:arylformamidase